VSAVYYSSSGAEHHHSLSEVSEPLPFSLACQDMIQVDQEANTLVRVADASGDRQPVAAAATSPFQWGGSIDLCLSTTYGFIYKDFDVCWD
jgi:hypothetical protein